MKIITTYEPLFVKGNLVPKGTVMEILEKELPKFLGVSEIVPEANKGPVVVVPETKKLEEESNKKLEGHKKKNKRRTK